MVDAVYIWRSISVDIHVLKDSAGHIGLDMPLFVRVYDCRRACLRVVIDLSVCPGICQGEVLMLSLRRLSFHFFLKWCQTSSNNRGILYTVSL